MRIVVLVLSLLFATPSLAQPVDATAVVRAAIVDYIRPAFADLATEATALEAEITALCASPEPEALDSVRAGFGTLVVAWSGVELLRVGPLLTENRVDRVLFWPDRKGIGLRQVQAILAEEDASATATGTLRDKSVAVQGLGALEYLLFGTGSDELAAAGSSFRCAYAVAIAGNLVDITTSLSAEWADPEGISRRMLQPQQSDPQYRSEREVLEAFVGVLAHGIEAVRDTRLLPFLGRGDADPRPKAALFWRSGMTVPAIRANFEGLAALFERSGIGVATADENLWVANGVMFEFANADRAAATIELPLPEALADGRQRRALDYLVILTQSLQALLGEQLSAALGLSVGFSSLDGD